jgi:hypothetical protein
VHRIFCMSVDGCGILRIAQTLNQDKIPPPSGKGRWSRTTIRKILRDPFYIGNGAAYRTRKVTGPGRKIYYAQRPEDEQVKMPDGTVPAIIDLELFEKVQQQLILNKQEAARNNKEPTVALLRCGMATCGYCGGNMYVGTLCKKGHQRRYIYRCTNGVIGRTDCGYFSIDVKILDAVVWKKAEEIIRHPELVEEALEAQKPEDTHKSEIELIQNELKKIANKRKKLVKSLEDDIDDDTYNDIKARLKTLAEEKQSWERQLLISQKRQEAVNEEIKAIEDFRQWCASERAKLDDPTHQATYDEKRRACRRLGLKARIWRVGHRPRYDIECKPPTIASPFL